MIHPNGPEVISPTVPPSVPHKIYAARPYMAQGPGGSTTIQYSIPAVPFNNSSPAGPQIIAAPQSAAGFISQNPNGQQMIIIHPNEPYQPAMVQPGQPGQQYYPMQQMIRCVHPQTGAVQQVARVPGNFQQQDGSPPGGYVLTAVSQHGGLVQHPSSVPAGQHQNYHGGPPQSPGQSSHIQTQYAITHPSPSSYLQNPQSPAQHTQQGANGPPGPAGAFRSPSAAMHSVGGQHHPQQPFVMVAHQGQHMQPVGMPNGQTYVQGQQYGGGILQNYTQN